MIRALVLRFFTGAAMALVYPMMGKVVSTWFVQGRGLAMGGVLGAVTVGAASPHLVTALAPGWNWQALVMTCSVISGVGGLIAALLLREGPFRQPRRRISVADLSNLRNNKEYCYATLAYFAHNWEIYALWTWIKEFATDPDNGGDGAGEAIYPSDDARGGALAAFIMVSLGFLGCLAGGYLADRIGRTSVCLVSLAISGTVSVVIGDVTDPATTIVLGAIWGITVVSDSAQYSTMVTEVVDKEVLGTAMTVQFGLGYLSTFPSIYLVPAVVEVHGWGWGWRLLAPGSIVGILALLRLRALPGAILIANGKK